MFGIAEHAPLCAESRPGRVACDARRTGRCAAKASLAALTPRASYAQNTLQSLSLVCLSGHEIGTARHSQQTRREVGFDIHHFGLSCLSQEQAKQAGCRLIPETRYSHPTPQASSPVCFDGLDASSAISTHSRRPWASSLSLELGMPPTLQARLAEGLKRRGTTHAITGHHRHLPQSR